MKNRLGFLTFKTLKFNNSHDTISCKSLRIPEFEDFCLDIKNILKLKNIDNEKLARLIDVPIEYLAPLDSNVTDLNLEVLNKVLEVIDIEVVIELQIKDFLILIRQRVTTYNWCNLIFFPSPSFIMLNYDFKDLVNKFPNPGSVTWIGVRPDRQMPMSSLKEVKVLENKLEGDHYNGRILSKRHVTFIQKEHIDVICSLLRKEVRPEQLRRNIVVKGINLLALKDKKFQIGEAVFEMSGLCHPCSRMEQNLGTGGYNAMRGHGGIIARILKGGLIKLGDKVTVFS